MQYPRRIFYGRRRTVPHGVAEIRQPPLAEKETRRVGHVAVPFPLSLSPGVQHAFHKIRLKAREWKTSSARPPGIFRASKKLQNANEASDTAPRQSNRDDISSPTSVEVHHTGPRRPTPSRSKYITQARNARPTAKGSPRRNAERTPTRNIGLCPETTTF